MIAARSHLVEARVKLDNMIRGLYATFGYRPGPRAGKAFLDRSWRRRTRLGSDQCGQIHETRMGSTPPSSAITDPDPSRGGQRSGLEILFSSHLQHRVAVPI